MDTKQKLNDLHGRVRQLWASGKPRVVAAGNQARAGIKPAIWPVLWLITVAMLARVTGDHSKTVDELEVCVKAIHALDAADLILREHTP